MNKEYEARVHKYWQDVPAGTVKDLKEVKEKDQFIKAVKTFIDQGGKAEFNASYTKVRKIK